MNKKIKYFLTALLIPSLSLITSNLFANDLKVRELTETELIDMLKGSCIQSTRTCDSSESISLIKKALQEGKKFKMISIDEFPDDGMVVAVQGIGGGGAWEHVIERTKSQNLSVISDDERNNLVVDLLSEFMDQEITAIIRSEAAEATATALLIAELLAQPFL